MGGHASRPRSQGQAAQSGIWGPCGTFLTPVPPACSLCKNRFTASASVVLVNRIASSASTFLVLAIQPLDPQDSLSCPRALPEGRP